MKLWLTQKVSVWVLFTYTKHTYLVPTLFACRYLYEVVVDPEYQRLGLASHLITLMETVVSVGFTKGLQRVYKGGSLQPCVSG
jgi:GNAT superfamily N-acetyltransferase